jgi:ATP-dependent Clp protease ATP-binding subunit ClpC
MVERMSGVGTRTPFTKIEFSPSTKRVLEYAVDEARRMGQHYISTEHLLLGLVRENDGVAMDVLRKFGVSAEQVRRQTRRMLKESPVASARETTSRPPQGQERKSKDAAGRSAGYRPDRAGRG